MRIRGLLVGLAIATASGCGSNAPTSDTASPEPTTTTAPVRSGPTTSTSTTTTTATTSSAPPAREEAVVEEDHGAVLVGRTFTSGDAFVRFERRGDGDVVAWRGACNTHGAAVDVRATALDVASDIAGTAMGCDREATAADDALTSLMQRDPEWSLDDRRLTLRAGADVRTFDEAP